MGFSFQSKMSEANIDQRAFESLVLHSSHFARVLGEPKRMDMALAFSGKGLSFPQLKVRYDVVKKFLGKVYVMVLKGQFLSDNLPPKTAQVELRYSGLIRRTMPRFVSSEKTGNAYGERIMKALNRDERLLEKCLKLDLEYLKVRFNRQQEVWEVELRPYGGSQVHLLVPPMRYNVMLPKEQADLIIPVMNQVVALVRLEHNSGDGKTRCEEEIWQDSL